MSALLLVRPPLRPCSRFLVILEGSIFQIIILVDFFIFLIGWLFKDQSAEALCFGSVVLDVLVLAIVIKSFKESFARI